MAGEWREFALSELADLSGGFAFKSKDYSDSGRFVLRTLNIRDDGSISRKDAVYLPLELCDQYTRFELQPLDTLFVMVGATLGKVGFVREHDLPALLNQNMWLIRAKPRISDRRFIQYAFRHAVKKSLGWASGSARDFVRRDDYRNLKIVAPIDVQEQQAIACILGALDDKIELNRQMNRTLEDIARAIFKSWFVDFDPVRAKAAGQQPPGLKSEIAALFPDSFEDSELGEIPQEWRVGTLGDVADVNWGDTNVTKKSYVDDGFLAYSAKGPDGLLPYYDYDRTGVVLSAIGANSGFTWLAQGKWSCIKNTIRFWCTDESLSTEYLFYATLGNHHWPLRGSAQPFVSQGDARNVHVLKPSENIGKLFGDTVRPLHEKSNFISREIVTLASIRDALLPKLISGDLIIADAERIAGRCA